MPKRSNNNSSIYDGLTITLTEQVNRKKLKYLLDHIKEFKLQKLVKIGDGTSTLDAQEAVLRKYYDELDDEGKIQIQYKQKPCVFGRYMPKQAANLTTINRKFRHTISKEYYYDLDVCNCHPEILLDYTKKNNIDTYSATLQNSNAYHKESYTKASAIVVGTEATGLTEIWRENATQNINIPMQGEIDSMNVSVAAAIVLFEAKRQRGF